MVKEGLKFLTAGYSAKELCEGIETGTETILGLLAESAKQLTTSEEVAQIATISKWIDAGMPMGDPKDMPPPATFDDDAWSIGKPDLIISLPEPDVDEELLLDALRAAGVDAQMSPWHESSAWKRPAPTVIRSTWDYIHRLHSFAEWIVQISVVAPLWNPAQIIFDNLHKRYLLDLAERGVPVTPTTVLDRGCEVNLATLCAARGWNDIVIKPAVGAGSFETYRVRGSTEEAVGVLRRLLDERDVLVQPFLRSVEGHGERALVWIDGEFTHAVRKSPRFAGNDEQVSEAMPISAAERRVGEALRALGYIE